ncbi:hypothetical protein F441_21638 [Phytophthora nicotianae CJ01A1]|uniref:Uncharacterized protein n=3 Tax=Phytophthora nicotianae TaxID=4792 RepID=V9DWM5_PHYNI|nr:hypothetical protein F443_21751 [Phytophthora nicotianae P1569]ETK71621.1 hypothetical protein L915_21150 [Phytophthora nicotianae]ETL25056.1 hypothetical protein L916_21025 [Phytophthora nicotianae]ETP01040.1 hypothetical protein F441_21638 [Phytophthora nicotianae CJ01A1]
MSTLTSAQLHVKRSSTRLHAPPGGASSLSFGCGGLGTAEPAEQAPNKEEPAYSRPRSSDRYAPPATSFSNNNNDGCSGYSVSQPEPIPYNNYAPPQQPYGQQPYGQQPYGQQPYQQQPYQQQPYTYPAPYNPTTQNNNSFSNQNYSNNNGFHGGRPPSSTPSSRSSTRSSSSSRSWGSQPPLTSSKRDQNWEKKRRQWLARKNSSNNNNYGERTSTPSSTWNSNPAGVMLDDSINPPSPLSRFMHQQQQQQQQQQQFPPTPCVDYQRLGTANSTRSTTSYTNHQPNPTPIQMRGARYPPAGAPLSRAGLSTASSTTSTTSSRRQPPGGQCQWSLG